MEILINPTPLEIAQASNREIEKEAKKIQLENFILHKENVNMRLELDWYRKQIEEARIDWGKIGADKALSILILAVKDR